MSPYRYGQCAGCRPRRDWVNDEPWGWATYHHGRWVWINGKWLLGPIRFLPKQAKSWWRPALVVMAFTKPRVLVSASLSIRLLQLQSTPLARSKRWESSGQGPVGTNPTPTSVPVERNPRAKIVAGHKVPYEVVPAKGVVAVSVEEFGQRRIGHGWNHHLSRKSFFRKYQIRTIPPPILPSFEEVKKRPRCGIVTAKQRPVILPTSVRTVCRDTNGRCSARQTLERTAYLRQPSAASPPLGQTPGIIRARRKRHNAAYRCGFKT